jgi:hypothetical protein
MDDRARVPFAFVGILLVLTSTSLSASVQPGIGPADPAVQRALETTTTELHPSIRGAVRTAARRAAADPVIEPANTSAGRLLNASRPFRDALRLRIALAAGARLDGVGGQRDGLTVDAGLGPNAGAVGPETAIDAVSMTAVGPSGSDLRVTVRNVTVTASREGRSLARRAVDVTVTVDSPVLGLHRRAATFQGRLDAGPTADGLAGRVTARTNAIAWGRGAAQYGGGPIENVVANRHLALVTNGALVDLQTATLGRADPAARAQLQLETGRTIGADLAEAAGTASSRVGRGQRRRSQAALLREGLEARNGTLPVSAATVADRTFVSESYLRRAIDAVYDVDARLTADREVLSRTPAGQPPTPGGEWTLDASRTRMETSVTTVTGANGSTAPHWHRFETAHRKVRVRITRTGYWVRANETRVTTSTGSRVVRVRLTLAGNHERAPGPGRPMPTVHRQGGPVDGPNLAGVASQARRTLVADRGGYDRLAARAARGRSVDRRTVVHAPRPDAATLTRWLRTELVPLVRSVRTASVAVDRRAVAGGTASPYARLATRLRANRSRLVDAPDRYASAADRVRVAARRTYLDSVIERLEARAATESGHRSALTQVGPAANMSTDPGAILDSGLEATVRSLAPHQEGWPRVALSPAYLRAESRACSAVEARCAGDLRPLGAQNVNYFAVPYGDAAAVATDVPERSDGTRLRTAAQQLQTGARVRAAVSTGESDGRPASRSAATAALRPAVDRGADHLERTVVRSFARTGFTDAQRQQAVIHALVGEDATPAVRALALTNATAAAALTAAAPRQWPDRLDDPARRTRLRIRLRTGLQRAREHPAARVNQTLALGQRKAIEELAATELRSGLEDASQRGTRRVIERVSDARLSAMPAGLPVAPVPGYWYATTNVWYVHVRGGYGRFALAAPTGPPDRPGRLVYERDGQMVRLDVDGDGADERLGTATRVTFDVETVVAIAVPPGGSGVGDTDGEVDERTEGWGEMGPK